MPQMASHVGSSGCPAASGFDALMATCATRRQAKRIQIRPVPNSVKMAFFFVRAIWRFQVSLIGRAMTVVQSVTRGNVREEQVRLTHEVGSRICRKRVVQTDQLRLLWPIASLAFTSVCDRSVACCLVELTHFPVQKPDIVPHERK